MKPREIRYTYSNWHALGNSSLLLAAALARCKDRRVRHTPTRQDRQNLFTKTKSCKRLGTYLSSLDWAPSSSAISRIIGWPPHCRYGYCPAMGMIGCSGSTCSRINGCFSVATLSGIGAWMMIWLGRWFAGVPRSLPEEECMEELKNWLADHACFLAATLLSNVHPNPL